MLAIQISCPKDKGLFLYLVPNHLVPSSRRFYFLFLPVLYQISSSCSYLLILVSCSYISCSYSLFPFVIYQFLFIVLSYRVPSFLFLLVSSLDFPNDNHM